MPSRPQTSGRTRTRKDARVALASMSAFLSDWAAVAVSTRTDDCVTAADHVAQARTVKLIGQSMQFMSVALMLLEGCSWEAVAAACGLPDIEAARVIYEEKYKAWASGADDSWTPPGIRATIPASAYGDPDAEAARLDQWCMAHDSDTVVSGLRPVTDGLY